MVKYRKLKKTHKRRKRSGMHKKMSANLHPPTLITPPPELLFGQPALSLSPRLSGRRRRSRKLTKYKNIINPFSGENSKEYYTSPTSSTQKPKMAQKHIKNAIAKRNRTLRLIKYRRPRRRRRSRRFR